MHPADQPEAAEPDWSRHNVCAVFAHLGASSLTGLMLRVNEASLFGGASLRGAFNSSLVWRQPLASTLLTLSSSEKPLESKKIGP